VNAVRYVAGQANTDADELESRARQFDGDTPASSSAVVTSAPPAKPALIFAPIASTPAAPAPEAQPEPATDSYNF
jgi:hypothetical protein